MVTTLPAPASTIDTVELVRTWGVAENGASVEVAVAPQLLPELKRRWPPRGLERAQHRVEPVEARVGLSDTWIIVPDVERSGTEPTPAARDQLESTLATFTVRRMATAVPMHAAVIEREGRLLVIPAAPEGGKSTLTIAAAEAGARVLSDEYSLIDPTNGLTSGWARPVRRRRRGGGIDRLPLATASDPRPVGLVALVSYDRDQPGSNPLEVQRLSAADAVTRMLDHIICTRTRPDDALDAALALSRRATVVAGTRGEAGPALAALFSYMDETHR